MEKDRLSVAGQPRDAVSTADTNPGGQPTAAAGLTNTWVMVPVMAQVLGPYMRVISVNKYSEHLKQTLVSVSYF